LRSHIRTTIAKGQTLSALAHIDAINDAAAAKQVVLVIEDERTQRMVLRSALEREGFRVVEASSGPEGLEAFDHIRPDIVLLDVRMPGMDGFATCAALRQREGGDRFPILMVTVLNDVESINRAYEVGATDFITKPIAWPILGHRLRYMLRASEAFSRLAQSEATLLRRVAERTAELDAANVQLEAFAYSVSHDLRAPLRRVLGFAGILKDEMPDLDSAQRALLDRVVSETHLMAMMIDDLLRLSQVSSGEFDFAAADLAALAGQTIEGLRADYPRAMIKVSALPTAHCNAGLIREVFENLIGNALKYSGRAAAPVVEVGMESSNGENVFFVRDNGAGFDMSQAAMLFGVFRRFHQQSDFPGTGVGLAIVKRIVERHRGRVWAQSAPNAGATFYFTLGDPARTTDGGT
jgi:two-component system sensor histidine kinase/response regulator